MRTRPSCRGELRFLSLDQRLAPTSTGHRLRESLPGTLLVMDRGYNDYAWFADLTRQGVYFVTRLKDNADYVVLEDRELPAAAA